MRTLILLNLTSQQQSPSINQTGLQAYVGELLRSTGACFLRALIEPCQPHQAPQRWHFSRGCRHKLMLTPGYPSRWFLTGTQQHRKPPLLHLVSVIKMLSMLPSPLPIIAVTWRIKLSCSTSVEVFQLALPKQGLNRESAQIIIIKNNLDQAVLQLLYRHCR